MGKHERRPVEAMLLRQKMQRRRNVLFLFLAVLVTAGIGGLFHRPAVAKTYQVMVLTCTAEAPVGPGYAGYFVHTHNDDCFDEDGYLVCPLTEIEAHAHDESCYSVTTTLSCTIPESDGHQHTEACYTLVRGDLTCEESTEPVLDEEGNVLAEGHVHTDECFAWTEELSCGLAEGEGAHRHDVGCFEYVTSLTCDKPEVIPHIHTNDCYQKNEDGSIYVDEGGNSFLTCGLPEVTEHVHGPECFTVYELDDGEPEEEPEAAPDVQAGDVGTADSGNEDAPADTSDAADDLKTDAYETADGSMPAQSFTGSTQDVTVSVEAPEGAFPEGTVMRVEAVEVDDETISAVAETVESKVKGFHAVDISFHDAEGNAVEPMIPIRVSMKSAIVTVSESENVALVHLPDAPESGEEEAEDPAPAPEVIRAEVVEQAADAEVPGDELLFESDAFSVYMIVWTETIEKEVITAEGETFLISISYGENVGIPEGARVAAFQVTEESDPETWKSSSARSLEAVTDDPDSVRAVTRVFDISIETEDGQKVEPKAPVEVKIAYMPETAGTGENAEISFSADKQETAAPEQESTVKVVHFVTEDDLQVIDPEVSAEDNGMEAVTFETESFSIYTVVQLQETESAADPNGLDGKSFAIVTNFTVNNNYVAVTADALANNQNRLAGRYMTSVNDNSTTYSNADANVTRWTFDYQGNDQYHIYTTVNGQIKYLRIDAGGDGSNTYLSDEPPALTVENKVEDNNTTYLITNGTNDLNLIFNNYNQGFGGATHGNNGQSWDNSWLRLCTYVPEGNNLNLDGAEFAIISTNRQVALTANGDNAGTSDPVIVDFDNRTYFSNAGVTMWKFTQVNGGYRISAQVGGAAKYLKLNGNNATMTLVDEDQADIFQITQQANGCVTIGRDGLYLSQWNGEKINSQNHGLQVDNNIFIGDSCNSFVLCTPGDTSLQEAAIFNPFGWDYANETVPALDESGESTGQRIGAGINGNKDNTHLNGRVEDLVYVWLEDGKVKYLYSQDVVDLFYILPVGDGQYILGGVDGEYRKYLKITAGGAHLDDPGVFYNGNIDDYKVDIAYDAAADRYTISKTINGTTYYLTLTDHSNRNNLQFGAETPKYTGDDARWQQFVFAEKGTIPVTREDAEKITVQGLRGVNSSSSVIIYYRTGTEGNYQYYAIDHDGKAVPVIDSGDTITFSESVKDSISWNVSSGLVEGSTEYRYMFSDPTAEASKRLLPTGTGLFTGEPYGVMLPGDSSATSYSSTIENWDNAAYQNYGITLNTETKTFQSVTDQQDGVFFFAVTPIPKNVEDVTLHRVDTVDSAANGITIHMFDYGDNQMWQNIITAGGWINGPATTGIMKRMLDGNGYPVPSNGENTDQVAALFDPSSANYKGDANHLFLQSVYDTTGYYHYRSWENYAYLDNGNFIVYDAIATPADDHLTAAFSHGNFMPYNPLENADGTLANGASKNYFMFDAEGRQLDTVDPRLGEAMYLLNTPNYYFGMTLETDFTQPKNGLIDGNPMRFEFNGDDDMWLYVDGVLLLDIGGIHDPRSGYIDFKTGVIHQEDGGDTTIRQRFIAAYTEAGKTQDEINALIAEKFGTGDTFLDYTKHHMKMFYLERGAGASNLDISFNLVSIPPASFTVEKSIVDLENKTDFNGFAEFRFKAYTKNTDASDYSLLTGTDVGTKTFIDGRTEKITIGEDGIFTLKPGEKVTFQTKNDEVRYYVEEVNLPEGLYTVTYNDGTAVTQTGGVASSGEATVESRAVLNVNNKTDFANLEITKLVEGVADLGDSFSFQVYMQDISQNSDDDLKPYNGSYYVKKRNSEESAWQYYNYNSAGDIIGWVLAGGNGEKASATPNKASTTGQIERIPAEFTIEIDNLLPGTKFMVKEINVPAEYQWTRYAVSNADNVVAGATVDGGASGAIETTKVNGVVPDAKVTVTNTRKTAGINLKKVASGTNTLLPGAEFKLYRKDSSGKYAVDERIDATKAETTLKLTDGTLTINGLPSGDYKLTETKAPAGYIIDHKDIYFTVNASGTGDVITTTEGGADYTKIGASTEGTNQDTLVIPNTPGVELPNTGGEGTILFSVLGTVLLLSSTLLILAKRKREASSYEPRH